MTRSPNKSSLGQCVESGVAGSLPISQMLRPWTMNPINRGSRVKGSKGGPPLFPSTGVSLSSGVISSFSFFIAQLRGVRARSPQRDKRALRGRPRGIGISSVRRGRGSIRFDWFIRRGPDIAAFERASTFTLRRRAAGASSFHTELKMSGFCLSLKFEILGSWQSVFKTSVKVTSNKEYGDGKDKHCTRKEIYIFISNIQRKCEEPLCVFNTAPPAQDFGPDQKHGASIAVKRTASKAQLHGARVWRNSFGLCFRWSVVFTFTSC